MFHIGFFNVNNLVQIHYPNREPSLRCGKSMRKTWILPHASHHGELIQQGTVCPRSLVQFLWYKWYVLMDKTSRTWCTLRGVKQTFGNISKLYYRAFKFSYSWILYSESLYKDGQDFSDTYIILRVYYYMSRSLVNI